MTRLKFSLAPIGPARLYYETAGEGWPLVMIHDGRGRSGGAGLFEEGGRGKNASPPFPPPHHPHPTTQMAVGGVFSDVVNPAIP